jgi:hypothetical protein
MDASPKRVLKLIQYTPFSDELQVYSRGPRKSDLTPPFQGGGPEPPAIRADKAPWVAGIGPLHNYIFIASLAEAP